VADVSERGVSTVVGYVLNITVALLLVTGLLVATSDYVATQRHQAAETQATVVTERLVNDLATADRLARTSDADRVTVAANAPERIVGHGYRVTVTDVGDAARIRLDVRGSSVAVTRTVAVGLDVQNDSRSGGPLTVAAANGTLAFRDGGVR